MSIREQITMFMSSTAFGVVGASANREKFGNKVLRCYLQHNLKAIPVNPKETEIEGIKCVTSVASLPEDVKSISLITPPQVTDNVVADAIEKGISNIWMQPGAESAKAVQMCRQNNINVIADGTCILVELGCEK